jgi:hypothetical protein
MWLVAPKPPRPGKPNTPQPLAGTARRENLQSAQQEAQSLRIRYAWLMNVIASDTTGSMQNLLDWVNKRIAQNLARARRGQPVPPTPFTQEEFDQEFNNTAWRQQYTSYEAQRRIEAADPNLSKDFEFRKETARNSILTVAGRFGVVLNEEDINELTDLAVFQGWDEQRIRRALEPLLERTIAGEADLIGEVGNAETQLMNWTRSNGLQLSRQALSKYLTNITLGRQTLDDVKADIRKTYLAGMFPGWADKINEGFDPLDLFEPYMNVARNLLELNDISFDDPLIKRFTQGVGGDGNPIKMPLWQFEQEIRKDPRWQQTDNAYKTYMDVGTNLLQMFGFR